MARVYQTRVTCKGKYITLGQKFWNNVNLSCILFTCIKYIEATQVALHMKTALN